MNDFFYKKYKCYENFPIKELKHIPEISFYNHNYYVGVKRENKAVPDLIYVKSDELTDTNEYYHVDRDTTIHIGYAYILDEFITLQEEELT